ncbi:hypothetical protein DPEC_G00252810 [Dallia pectoralis]|uniref:Uncharacterized protein n=1 Tax=Dallia pectoralis TaxID=75939 RepID=A0ACC2FTM8_DALPE|nr:hypothetical protein DPEC_G00252810 [Dallia pectoralis]
MSRCTHKVQQPPQSILTEILEGVEKRRGEIWRAVPLLRDSRGSPLLPQRCSVGLSGLLGHSFVIMTFNPGRPVCREECLRCLPWLRLMVSRHIISAPRLRDSPLANGIAGRTLPPTMHFTHSGAIYHFLWTRAMVSLLLTQLFSCPGNY